MSGYRVQDNASHRLDEIYLYSVQAWGEAQADRYIHALFEQFAAIAARRLPWRPIPAEFGAEGFMYRYQKHWIYWKCLGDGDIGIVTILPERMHQVDRFRDDFE